MKKGPTLLWPVGSRSPTFLYASEKYWDLYEGLPELADNRERRRTPFGSGARARFTIITTGE